MKDKRPVLDHLKGAEMYMSIDQLRKEVRSVWDDKSDFDDDLMSLPEYPSLGTLRILKDAAMGNRYYDLKQKGLALREKWYTDHPKQARQTTVDWIFSCPFPRKTEYEIAAGLWCEIRKILLGATS